MKLLEVLTQNWETGVWVTSLVGLTALEIWNTRRKTELVKSLTQSLFDYEKSLFDIQKSYLDKLEERVARLEERKNETIDSEPQVAIVDSDESGKNDDDSSDKSSDDSSDKSSDSSESTHSDDLYIDS